MDIVESLFDYQRFKENARLGALVRDVYDRYLADGRALDDDAMNLAAAGEPDLLPGSVPPDGAADGSDG